jgi:hypothetical protein
MNTDDYILRLRQAYHAGALTYEEFRQRFNAAMREAANSNFKRGIVE